MQQSFQEQSSIIYQESDIEESDKTKIQKENQLKIEQYIQETSNMVTENILIYIKDLDQQRIENIKTSLPKHKNSKGQLVETKEEIKKEPANQQFIEMLQSVQNVIKQLNSLTQSCSNFDQKTKQRLLDILEKINKQVSISCVKEDWIFVESDEILLVFHEYFQKVLNLRQDLQKVMNKNFLCGSQKSKSMKSFNLKLDIIEREFPQIQILLNLKARMSKHVSIINGGQKEIPPTPFELDNEGLTLLVEEIVRSNFPQLKPIKEIQVKIQKEIEVKNQIQKIFQKEEKSAFLIGQEFFYGFGQPQNFFKAKEQFLQAEQQGNVEASVILGKMFLKGKGVAKDYKKAFQHFQLAAKKNNADAQYYIGHMLENNFISGQSVQGNQREAVEYFKKASEQNQSNALTDLGFFYENGVFVNKNNQMALDYYKKAVALKNPRAMNNLATFYLKEENKDLFKGETDQRAFKLYEESVNLGYVNAYTNLGICYLKGIGVPKDTINARNLFNKASDLGDSDGMFYKAYFILKEASKTQSDEMFFQSACLLRSVIQLNKNHSDANYYMGYLYENGLGVDQDYKAAFNYYSLSNQYSKETNTKALYKLGNFYYGGSGSTIVNKEKAFYFYKKSADQGDSDALNRLGEIYDQGFDVERDVRMAENYYRQSIEKGNNEAKVNLAMLLMNDQDQTGNEQPEQLLMEAAQKGNQRAKAFMESVISQRNNNWVYGSVMQKSKQNSFMKPQVETSYMTNLTKNNTLRYISTEIIDSDGQIVLEINPKKVIQKRRKLKVKQRQEKTKKFNEALYVEDVVQRMLFNKAQQPPRELSFATDFKNFFIMVVKFFLKFFSFAYFKIPEIVRWAILPAKYIGMMKQATVIDQKITLIKNSLPKTYQFENEFYDDMSDQMIKLFVDLDSSENKISNLDFKIN